MAIYRHIYVHVPFCEVICHYCHFYTARTKEADQERFFAALRKHLGSEALLLGPGLEAVYFGGGTPAASPPELIASFLEALGPRLRPQAEVTIEANPNNVSRENVRAWKAAGINRVSLGVQSLDDNLLKKLGRAHDSRQALLALETVRAEIDNVSCDLIYAVPAQGEEQPAKEALELVKRGATHLSAYHLTLEKEHFLHASLPTDDFAWHQLRHVAGRLEPLGHEHYEVASFAAPGRQSRNNKNYWSGGPYLAFGPSAHGFDGGNERWSQLSDWRQYIERVENGQNTRSWTENLTPEQRRIEVIFTSLRTDQGLDLKGFEEKFGIDLLGQKKALLERWEKEGLGHLAQGKFVLTFPGRMLVDEIAKSLL